MSFLAPQPTYPRSNSTTSHASSLATTGSNSMSPSPSFRSRSPVPSSAPFDQDSFTTSSPDPSGSTSTGPPPVSRTRGPPLRSTTMDDRYYVGPGAPSAQTRGYAEPRGQQWGAATQPPVLRDNGHQVFAPPRAPGLYNQGNHSSPSLALPAHGAPGGSASLNDPPSVPPIPSMDDINLSLENMRFSQRDPGTRVNRGGAGAIGDERRWAAEGGGGQDGAMEIRGREGNTASVYSLDSVYSTNSAGEGVAGEGMGGGHARKDSAASSLRLGVVGGLGGGLDHRRDSAGGVGAGQYDGDPEGSFLPYDDHYLGDNTPPGTTHQQSPQLHVPSSTHPSQQQQQFDYYPNGPAPGQPQYYAEPGPSSSPYYHPDDPRSHPHLQQQPHHPSPYGHHPPQQGGPYHQQQQPPTFHPQPPHGGWSYDNGAAAAQNPYYAAATGQMGYPGGDPNGPYGGGPPPGGLNRAPSTMSMGLGGTMAGGGGGGRGSATSSLNVPNPGIRRKGTSSSNGSTQSNGPPITKQSVDEYRQRIKADPDPEAQFNFAKYLIEAAKKINSSASGDEKSAKKYRDALLAESLKLIKRLATQAGVGKPAYADAQFFLANCLGNGSLGLQVDHEKAYNLYVQASKQNHSSATYRTAVCNEVGAGTRRDHARAVLFYRKASALGDTAGMYKLGMILLNGLLGQQRNPKEAFAWLKRAASQADEDNPHALHELGLLYEKPPPPSGAPTIVPFDPAQARELFTQAGQFGYPPSQFKLGSCYEYGSLTCPVDPRRSIAWYTRAAERGDAESELALSGWYLTGSEGVLKQSDSEAYLWARRAANKGLPKAEYAVGYYSEVGIGVKMDLEEAKRWYMRAAAQGNKRAMQRLTELKKLGAEKGRGGKTKGSAARPTRQEAETECVIQ